MQQTLSSATTRARPETWSPSQPPLASPPKKPPYFTAAFIGIGVIVIILAVFLGIRLRGGGQQIVLESEQKTVGIVQIWRRLDRFPAGFKEGLAELGYIEGQDIIYKYNSWEHDPAKIDAIVQGYIDENVDMIFAVAAPSALQSLKLTVQAKKEIPIVYVVVDKPDEIGLIESFQSSGNHVTGVASNMADLVPKQLEILKRVNPDAKRIGVFNEGFKIPGNDAPGTFVLEALRKHTPTFGLELVEYSTQVPPGPGLDKAFTDVANNIKPGDINATYHIPGHFLVYQDVNEVDLGKRLGIPALMPIMEEVESSGGLFSVSGDSFEVGRQTAVMADKIFRGTHPSQIPSEMPRKDIFTLNITGARQLGIEIPQDILDLADVKF